MLSTWLSISCRQSHFQSLHFLQGNLSPIFYHYKFLVPWQATDFVYAISNHGSTKCPTFLYLWIRRNSKWWILLIILTYPTRNILLFHYTRTHYLPGTNLPRPPTHRITISSPAVVTQCELRFSFFIIRYGGDAARNWIS